MLLEKINENVELAGRVEATEVTPTSSPVLATPALVTALAVSTAFTQRATSAK